MCTSTFSAEIACHFDSLYKYAILLATDSSSAARLVEKTCLAATPALLQHKGTTSKSRLFSIMRKIWQSQLNHANPVGERFHDCDTRAISQFRANGYQRDFDVERVRTAFERLPPGIREILLLKEFEGLSYREIAAILECSYHTVTLRLACARSLLCELLSASHPAQRQTVE